MWRSYQLSAISYQLIGTTGEWKKGVRKKGVRMNFPERPFALDASPDARGLVSRVRCFAEIHPYTFFPDERKTCDSIGKRSSWMVPE
jgi:hypothetical protein